MEKNDQGVLFKEALKFWVRLGFVSFGGPAGQIAIMHREVVQRQGWLSENAFLRALNFCMLLPGPEAQQLATYIGWRLHGIRGGLTAGVLFVAPSVLVMLLLAYMAVAHIDLPAVAAAFYGIQPVVVAVVVEALWRIGKKTLNHPALYLFAALAFIAIFYLKIPFPVIVAGAALGGLLLQRLSPQSLCRGTYDVEAKECLVALEPVSAKARALATPGHVLKVFGVCFGAWLAVMGPVWGLGGMSGTLSQIGLFFTKAAFVTFGGAYAVLAYIADVGVSKGWLAMEQMLIGLGLAESTPGPLIMVTQYVGFLGGWTLPGSLTPLISGIAGALITTYVTFLPCFLFIFAGAPFIETMAGNQRLQAALIGVTAAVVGVILNLAVWFGGKVLFPEAGLDGIAVALAGISFVLLQQFHFPVHYLVPVGAAAGIILKMAF